MSLAKPINLVMRGLQFLWALLVMSLVGNLIAMKGSGGTSAIIGYSMFCAVIGMLSLFYLIPATIKESLAISPYFPLIVDLANTLFWFCGAVALAAELGVHSCNNTKYLKHNSVVNVVKHGRSGYCTEAQASCAFLWFGFAAFAVSTVFSGLNTRGGGVRPGGIRRTGPSMSQV